MALGGQYVPTARRYSQIDGALAATLRIILRSAYHGLGVSI